MSLRRPCRISGPLDRSGIPRPEVSISSARYDNQDRHATPVFFHSAGLSTQPRIRVSPASRFSGLRRGLNLRLPRAQASGTRAVPTRVVTAMQTIQKAQRYHFRSGPLLEDLKLHNRKSDQAQRAFQERMRGRSYRKAGQNLRIAFAHRCRMSFFQKRYSPLCKPAGTLPGGDSAGELGRPVSIKDRLVFIGGVWIYMAPSHGWGTTGQASAWLKMHCRGDQRLSCIICSTSFLTRSDAARSPCA